ncbi:hypothetical protein NUW58_g8786 [Xylaria curta]|uniref:Uncharacterized protein n=1 Tax=Xylaria curta TaxID=42375 RepID=A0ACC1N432_9PEZI|nr:hypothetical protein NUW58_g8786 [Xylaria curta]
MMLPTLTALVALGSMVTAAPAPAPSVSHKLLIGGPAQIFTYDYAGAFQKTSNYTASGAAFSWMRYKASTNTLYATDENAASINEFTLDAQSKSNIAFRSLANGSQGVVYLEFNQDQTRMFGASYGGGTVDTWDTSDSLKLIKSVNITTGSIGPSPQQKQHRAHQAILDPTGRYVIVPDLGADQFVVMDIKDDSYKVTNNVTLSPGYGPRHGSFVGAEGSTFFIVVCELSNMAVLYEAELNSRLRPTNASTAAAGAIFVAANNKDVYISNRLTGDDQDNIAHFVFDGKAKTLTHAESTRSGGILPRSISLSTDKEQSLLFVANQGGELGLAVFGRCAKSGLLTPKPVASIDMKDLIPAGTKPEEKLGPQFIAAI